MALRTRTSSGFGQMVGDAVGVDAASPREGLGGQDASWKVHHCPQPAVGFATGDGVGARFASDDPADLGGDGLAGGRGALCLAGDVEPLLVVAELGGVVLDDHSSGRLSQWWIGDDVVFSAARYPNPKRSDQPLVSVLVKSAQRSAEVRIALGRHLGTRAGNTAVPRNRQVATLEEYDSAVGGVAQAQHADRPRPA